MRGRRVRVARGCGGIAGAISIFTMRVEPVTDDEAGGYWIVSRYAEVIAVLANPGDFSSAQGVGPDKVAVPMMLTQDPPTHTRLRALVQKAFTPRMIAQREPR